MLTPCVDVCVINEKTGLCEGCYRSLDEIAGWGRMTDAERARIMATLPSRRHPAEMRAAAGPVVAGQQVTGQTVRGE